MVRKMKIEDIEDVHALEIQCFSSPWSKDSLAKEVDNDSSMFFVYEINGEVVGYAGMYLIIDEGDITNVAVSADYRRKGIAREILEKMFEEAEKKHIKAFTLEVRKSNHAAIDLYTSIGFVTEGCRKNFYDNPKEDGLIMWKRD